MVTVNEELTQKVADLARLALNDDEVKLFTTQLNEILKYVEHLDQVDVRIGGEEVEPMTHPLELTAPLREDEPKPSPVDDQGKPKMLKSAPDVLYDGYKVPPIL